MSNKGHTQQRNPGSYDSDADHEDRDEGRFEANPRASDKRNHKRDDQDGNKRKRRQSGNSGSPG
ncbi:MAG TPA: hypothetical protein VGR26_01155 [Acidimicrobiales bacterium]|nr:hypothetical protein [Acidimicrobiales bacterium]